MAERTDFNAPEPRASENDLGMAEEFYIETRFVTRRWNWRNFRR